jgi:hypothetical protein
MFSVHTNGGTGSSCTTTTKCHTRSIRHQEANAVLLENRSIDRFHVHEVVRLFDRVHATRIPVFAAVSAHLVHHGSGLYLVYTLEIPPRVEVAAVLLLVLCKNVLNRQQRHALLGIEVRQNLQSGQDSPDAVLFANVVRASTNGFFTAEKGCELLSAESSRRVHQNSKVLRANERQSGARSNTMGWPAALDLKAAVRAKLT